jgi:hypothetical protein
MLKSWVAPALELLSEIVQRDPEVYEARAVKRHARRYLSFMGMSVYEQDPERKMHLIARGMAARTALTHLEIRPDALSSLDLAVHLLVSGKRR